MQNGSTNCVVPRYLSEACKITYNRFKYKGRYEMTKHQKTYTQVVDYFRERILAGELRPGDKLPPEREVAEELGVSRNSVREAIKVLDMTGVISSQQGSGNYITCDFDKSIAQTMTMMFAMHRVDYSMISQVRYTLERQAFSLACDKATEEQIEEIEQLIAELDASDDERVRARKDKEIHYKISKASGNVLIADILEACSGVIDTFVVDMRAKIMRNERDKERLNNSHRELVQALRDGDREKGFKALDHHFELIDVILEEEKIVITGEDVLRRRKELSEEENLA